jgi:hypothetical protein
MVRSDLTFQLHSLWRTKPCNFHGIEPGQQSPKLEELPQSIRCSVQTEYLCNNLHFLLGEENNFAFLKGILNHIYIGHKTATILPSRGFAIKSNTFRTILLLLSEWEPQEVSTVLSTQSPTSNSSKWPLCLPIRHASGWKQGPCCTKFWCPGFPITQPTNSTE